MTLDELNAANMRSLKIDMAVGLAGFAAWAIARAVAPPPVVTAVRVTAGIIMMARGVYSAQQTNKRAMDANFPMTAEAK